MATATTTVQKFDQSAFELLTDPSYLVNDDMIITWANDAFFKEFKLKKTQVLNKLTCEESCPSQLCGTKDCPIVKSKRLKKKANGDALYTGNGSVAYWYNSKATPIDGRGTLVSMANITKEKALQAKRSEERRVGKECRL